MAVQQCHYKILGVSYDCPMEEIKKNYRKLALLHHPDKGGNEETFKNLSIAYNILSDAKQRQAYDQKQKIGGTNWKTQGSKYAQDYPRNSQTHSSFFTPASSTSPTSPPPPPPPPPSTSPPPPPPRPSNDSVPENQYRYKSWKASLTHLSRYAEGKTGDSVRLKIVTVGDVQTGKSCLIKKYCEHRFVSKYIPTIGVDFGVKSVPVVVGEKERRGEERRGEERRGEERKGEERRKREIMVQMNFFDTSGDGTFFDDYSKNQIFSQTNIFFLVYDVSSNSSFEYLNKIIKNIKIHQKSSLPSTLILVANKIDLSHRKISTSEGKLFASLNNALYIETSTLKNLNINELFEDAIHVALDNIAKHLS